MRECTNELLHKLSILSSNKKKRHYFMWRNGLVNNFMDYSGITQDEFINKYCEGSKDSFRYLQLWEQSDEYNNLMQILLKQRMQTDFVEIYNAVRDKALKGDDKAVKTFLSLQKEVKANVKEIDKIKVDKNTETEPETEEDDGLMLE